MRLNPLCLSAVLALITSLAATPSVAEPRWTRGGPEGGGGFLSVAVAPSSPDVVYAGGTYDLFRSDDFGDTWRDVAPGRTPPIRRLTVHPREPETLLAAAFDLGMQRSEDGGATWTPIAAPQDPDHPLLTWRVAFDTAGTAFALQDDRRADFVGIVRSDDGGASWSTCGELPDRFFERYSPVVDPRRPGHLLAVANEGLWRSTDGCATWTAVAGELIAPDASVSALAFGDTDGELWATRMYTRSLHRSVDGGETWSFVFESEGLEIDELVVDPVVPGRVFLRVERTLYITEDDGASWRESTPQQGPPPVFYPIEVTAPPGTPGRLLAKTPRGIERSLDAGETWQSVRRGMVSMASFRRLRIHPNRPAEMWGAGWGGLARSTDGGRTWQWVDTGPDSPLEFFDVQIDGRNGVIYGGADRAGMVFSEDDGATWTRVDIPEQERAWPYRLAIDPHDTKRLIAGSRFGPGSRLSLYEDHGAIIRSRDIIGFPNAMHFDPLTPGRIVVSTNFGIFVLDDFDGALRQTLDIPGGGLMTASPASPERLWAVTTDRDDAAVWRSDDFGETWTRAGDLVAHVGSEWVRQIATLSASPHDADILYLGAFSSPTSTRTWRSDDGGATWQDVIVPGDPYVQQVVTSPDDPQVAWFATRDTGVLRRDNGPLPACLEDQGRCLRSGRFEVIVDWRDAGGNSGRATRVVDEIDTSALFWFFDEDNWELMVKILDGCGLNDRFWVLSAATTDVELTLRVEDRWSGLSRTYVDPLGRPAKARIDNDAFATCGVAPPEGADTSPPTAASGDLGPELELADGRFRASVTWEIGGATGEGRAAPLRTGDSGIFWFFDPTNWEMLVKVLDGCAINGHHWVLAGISSDVGYALRVEDTETGAVRVYEHPAGSPAPALVEIEAFACNN